MRIITLISGIISFLACNFAWADIYVYKHRDGTILITEHPQTANSSYTLMEVKRSINQPKIAPKVNVYTTKRSKPQKKIIHSKYDATIKAIARQHGVDDKIIKAMVQVESAFRSSAVSPKGAQGLMQLMPGTAKRYGVNNSFDPVQNLLGGVRYFKDLLEMFNNNLTLALAAYNAGEGAVQKYKGIPPYKETRLYVQKVIHYHRLYSLANT